MLKQSPWIVLLSAPLILLSGCKDSPSTQAQTSPATRPVPVDVAIAELENLTIPRQFTGTTNPIKEVTLRARIEGQLVSLNADRGDFLKQGQLVGQQDDGVLRANVLQAEAELAAREGELARTQTLVTNAQAQIERTKLEYQQALADGKRLQQLAKVGAVTTQQAEQAMTRANTALQSLRSAESQLKSQQAEIATAQKRVEAQRAIVKQATERLSFTLLRSPIDGIVMDKILEEGSLLQPGNEIIRVGDFSAVKVIVEVSELDRAGLQVGQGADISLDAFPKKVMQGKISRISPAADPQSRLIPIEVTIPNPNQRIGSGLLARVRFLAPEKKGLAAPMTALRVGGRPDPSKKEKKIFVIQRSGEEITVKTRPIVVSGEQDGRIIIQSGLAPGEEYVIRSGRPLKEGDKVVLSVLSQTGEKNDKPRN
jgi:RND family efflux transporter MFP subunit